MWPTTTSTRCARTWPNSEWPRRRLVARLRRAAGGQRKPSATIRLRMRAIPKRMPPMFGERRPRTSPRPLPHCPAIPSSSAGSRSCAGGLGSLSGRLRRQVRPRPSEVARPFSASRDKRCRLKFASSGASARLTPSCGRSPRGVAPAQDSSICPKASCGGMSRPWAELGTTLRRRRLTSACTPPRVTLGLSSRHIGRRLRRTPKPRVASAGGAWCGAAASKGPGNSGECSLMSRRTASASRRRSPEWLRARTSSVTFAISAYA
mmetsp:Transcript_84502/g.244010  ORF Transcript_84502/g.244010 Transcript_84502/m.244010 type:complete len:263 (+) Transcript_84502:377-1165(+)